MAHDEAAAGLLQHVTDTHLADRARCGEAVAFDELVRRHAELVSRFATVVTGDEELAPDATVRAFTDVFDQIGSGGYSIEDPFLPGLLRSTRDVARIQAGASEDRLFSPTPPAGADPAIAELVWKLPEPQRSVRWLEGVAGLDEYDLALALGQPEDEVAALAARSAAALGSRAEAAHLVLAGVEPTLLPSTPVAARDTWRSWVAATSGLATVGEVRERTPLLTRIEPVATRMLRGAAVLLFLAGGTGILLGNGGGGGSAGGIGGPGRGGGSEVALDASRDGSGSSISGDRSSTGGQDIDLASSTRPGGSASGPGPSAGTSSTHRSGDGFGGSTGSSASTGSSSGAGSTSAGGSTTGSTGGSATPSGGAGAPTGGGTAPNAPTGGTPSTPAGPSTPPATAPPATTPPVTAPPATTPPPVVTPTTTPPPATPSNPVTTVTGIVTTVVGGVTTPLTGALGGGN